VSSKSGGTVETDSHRRIFAKAFTDAGIDAARRIVVVTDPGSPLAELSEKEGYRKTFLADPHVGGRYSALTAFGLVPAGLAGADVARLLDQAAVVAETLASDSADNPAVKLAAAWGAAHAGGAEKVVLADSGSGIKGFPDWAEQLIAESTGKQGTGLLPVAVEGLQAPGFADAKDDATPVAIGTPAGAAKVAVTGPLGAQLLLWEFATALAGRLIGINPFDQPDVEAAKVKTRDLTEAYEKAGALPEARSFFEGDGIKLFADPRNETALKPQATSLTAALKAHFGRIGVGDYAALLAYVERSPAHIDVMQRIRRTIRDRTRAATCVGFGPRFQHSTGQAYKGGPNSGVFLQITCDDPEDLPVPGQSYTFGIVKEAQARGDFDVLAERGRRALRAHITGDLDTGLARLARAIEQALQ